MATFDNCRTGCRFSGVMFQVKFKGRQKYNNKKVVIDGIEFSSKKEAQRYAELKLLERAGEISDLQTQVKFELIPKQNGERAVNYIADFVYLDKSGKRIVEDTKGYRTRDYIIKRKLMLYVHGIKIRET